MPEKTAAAGKTLHAPKRGTRLGIHARVIAIAVVFGLAAYAVVHGLIAITRALGWLDWMHP
jgi:hypothetical protein